MIGTASLIGAGIGVGGSILGKFKEADARNKYEDWVDKQSEKLESWYAKESGTDYLDTAEGRSAASGLRKTLKENTEKSEEGAIKTGGSHESDVATRDQVFESLGDSYRKIAGLGTQRKANLRNIYENRKGQLDSQKANTMQGKAESWGTFANNAGGTIGNWIKTGAEAGAFDDMFSKDK